MAYPSRGQAILAAVACVLIALPVGYAWLNRPGAHDAALRRAVMKGDLTETERLLDKGANPNLPALNCFVPALKTALLNHNKAHEKEIIALLLKHGADPNFVLADGTPLVTYAVVFDYISPEIVTLLAENGADLNLKDRKGNTVLQTVLRHGDGTGGLTMVAALLDGGADPNPRQNDGRTALHLALWRPSSNRAKLVQMLAEHGVDPNIRDHDGFTPLAGYGYYNEDVILALVAAGSDLEARNREGFTALQMAAAHRRSRASIAMVQKGANVNAEYPDGSTPLFSAANHGDVALAKAMLAKGADVNHANSTGRTPLHNAASNFQREMVAYLIEQGAKLDARNKQGLTPLEYARSRKPKTPEAEARKQATIAYLEARGNR
jgi:ankyrin repeat protein